MKRLVEIASVMLCAALVNFVEARRLVYVGSYSTIIPIYELHDNGQMSLLSVVKEAHINNPSWLTIDSSNSFLYAVSELDDSQGGGLVSAYRIEDGGTTLVFLNQVSSHGSLPCHMTLDSKGRHLYVSTYGGATLAVLDILADGRLGQVIQLVDHDASAGAHVHEAVLDEALGTMQVMDLGLSKIFQYRYDAVTGLLALETVVELTEGSGPRHVVIHPYLPVSLVISELDNSLSCLSYNHQTGLVGEVLATVSTLRVGESTEDMGAAELGLSRDGQFVYASNRDLSDPNKQRSSIAVFKLFSSAEKPCVLANVQHVSSLGIHPRHFDLTYGSTAEEQLLLVANRDSNNIVSFRVSNENGRISDGAVLEDAVSPTQVLIVHV